MPPRTTAIVRLLSGAAVAVVATLAVLAAALAPVPHASPVSHQRFAPSSVVIRDSAGGANYPTPKVSFSSQAQPAPVQSSQISLPRHKARPVAYTQIDAAETTDDEPEPTVADPASRPSLPEQPIDPQLPIPSRPPLPTRPPVVGPPMTPPVPRLEEIPVGDPALADRVQVTRNRDLLSLTARDAPLDAVLGLIAKQHGLNIVTGQQVNQRVTVTLTDVRLNNLLDALLSVNGYAWTVQGNILIVSPLGGTQKVGALAQGRIVRVFQLNYVAAADIDKVVKGLLTTAGQSFIVETSPTDQRRTHETIVVEDLPYSVDRIEQYIRSVDFQPRQVVVEAHVLQVQLKDECKHGVNFEQILRIANSEVALQTQGFASATASPAAILRIDGTDLNAVVEALKTTTDAKTLASPKVAVLNAQEARLQIGGKIGYLTTTTTETTAVQTVNFLDTGVILVVTPIITADNQILLTVKPEVSTGQINPTTNLPESKTTEVETKVMLADGEAVIIGGLIQELDNEVQNKIPWLGDIKYVGRLFQRRSITRERTEVIIALLPRIISDVPGCRQTNPAQIEQARTPLFTGPLNRVDRTQWEPTLPDATQNPPRYCPPPPPDYSVPYGDPNVPYGPAPGYGTAPVYGPGPTTLHINPEPLPPIEMQRP